MTPLPFRIGPLSEGHDRSPFRSGSSSLDDYFRHRVTQDIQRRVAACFVATANDQRIVGFYTLSSASVPLIDLPTEIGKRLPRYPSVPAARMGRLAVDADFQGQGLGGALLADALVRSVRSELVAHAMVVDAVDGTAAAFYRHHGFTALPDAPLTLILPLATVRQLAL